MPAGAPVGVVVCVVAVFEVARRDDVASPDEADEVVTQGEVRDLHDLRLRPVSPDRALGAEDEFVAGVQREVRVAEYAPRLAQRPEHARRLAVGVQLGHGGEALGLYAKLVDKRKVESAADERGDLLRRGRAVADHDALVGKLLSHALAELGAEEHLPVSALLVGKVGRVEVPATVFAADGLLVAGHLARQVATALFMEKLYHVAVGELLEGLAVARDALVELLDEIGVCLRRVARVVGPLLIRRAHRHLPWSPLLFALNRREPALAVARLEHHVELLLGMWVGAVVSAGERPACVRRLVPSLAVVRRKNSEGGFVFGDDPACLVPELVEKSVPADVVVLEVHWNRKLLASLLERKLLGPALERLEVGVGDLDLDVSLRAVALGGDLNGAFLLVLSLLEDVAAAPP